MCGITGVFAFNEIGRISMIHLSNATETLSKRGPDHSNVFLDYFVGLGHCRLSILDTSPAAHQPMSDPNERYTVVFNGEIYNYKEIKKDLAGKGVTFHSDSDTEVLLQAYIQYGAKCLDLFNGFFAFAIFDKEDNSLFVARDHIGIKPLLYSIDEDKFLFASEMKALSTLGIDKTIDPSSLKTYLQLNYIPAPATIYSSVQKLLPGHYLELKNGEVKITQYYQISQKSTNQQCTSLSYEDQKKKFLELFEGSVQKRLISDVSLGAFLSGGIDSSAVVAMASKHIDNLHTFSVGYADEPFFDETKYANIVAKHFGTKHTVFKLTNRDLYEHLFDVLDYIDEPFADSSALAVYILSKRTKEHVTVALSGDGADEMFAGYNKHYGEYKVRDKGFAAKMVTSLSKLWEVLPKSRNAPMGNKVRQLHRFAEGNKLSADQRYWLWASFATETEAEQLLSEEMKEKLNKANYQEKKEKSLQFIKDKDSKVESFNEVLYTDMNMVLTGDMLTKVDLMSMANSLEVRVPFLDHKLVDFAFELPVSSKINHKIRKKIVQESFKDILPQELFKRPKHGFEVPLLKWLRGELRGIIEDDLLSDTYIKEQGVFDVEAIRALKTQLFSNNPGDIHARIWGLLVFQYWWKNNS